MFEENRFFYFLPFPAQTNNPIFLKSNTFLDKSTQEPHLFQVCDFRNRQKYVSSFILGNFRPFQSKYNDSILNKKVKYAFMDQPQTILGPIIREPEFPLDMQFGRMIENIKLFHFKLFLDKSNSFSGKVQSPVLLPSPPEDWSPLLRTLPYGSLNENQKYLLSQF